MHTFPTADDTDVCCDVCHLVARRDTSVALVPSELQRFCASCASEVRDKAVRSADHSDQRAASPLPKLLLTSILSFTTE